MEEQVGALWHRVITRLSDDRFPEAAVPLGAVAHTVGILFRALGGDGGLQVEAASPSVIRAHRSWLQRVAGSHRKIELAWRDDRTLRLPAVIDWFPRTELNRELYLWLAALAVGDRGIRDPWFTDNQRLSAAALRRFPGLRPRYQRLVRAHLAFRPNPDRLPRDDGQREQAIRQALLDPGSVEALPGAKGDPYPVPLWLHPTPPRPVSASGERDALPNNDERRGGLNDLQHRGRRPAERVATPQEDRGLATIRMENILSWGEFVKLDRSTEDEEDLDRAARVAEDLDRLAVARNNKAAAARLRFDLDLPAEFEDDLVLQDGILLPEWDWKRQRLQPDHCRIQSMLSAQAKPTGLPDHLRRSAKRLRNQFQALAPARVWHRAQCDGQEVDLDAYLRYQADRRAGCAVAADALYREMRSGARDLACLLIADLSLSTDTWIDDRQRVIDVIRDSLFLFAESLAATGDRFAMYGFSSRKRDPVRVHRIKDFAEGYSAAVRGRIQAIRPGYYTRMGAGIRHAAGILAGQSAGRRLLLLLTDGKPNDLDKYEGRYGMEDTRQAVREARRSGLLPFCVTIDREGNDYLPHLFGNGGYAVIRRSGELPKRLPLMYAQLTA